MKAKLSRKFERDDGGMTVEQGNGQLLVEKRGKSLKQSREARRVGGVSVSKIHVTSEKETSSHQLQGRRGGN
jgi:hypothetical protein